jgi:quercetin dioxygenase-like cupin family protein
MKAKIKLIVGAATLALIGTAVATPIVKLTTPLFSVGNQDADIHKHGKFVSNGEEQFSAVLKTDGPSTVSIQDGAILAGGQNGWHTHPGLVIVTLISGSIEWYDADCQTTVYKAGDSWAEGSQLHAFKVLGSNGIHFSAVFITAKGQPLRTDQPVPPPCAAGLGL